MNRITMLAAAGVLVLGIGGCVDRSAQERAKATQKLVTDPTILVTTLPVTARTVSETLQITGDVTTSSDVQVGAKISGRIVGVYVNEGDSVRAGQLIASQDSSQQLANLQQAMAAVGSARSALSQALANAAVGPSKSSASVRQAEAQLRSAQAAYAKARSGARPEERVQAQAQVNAAKSNVDTAKRELERTTQLVNEGAVPRTRLDTAQNAYQAALTQYEAAVQAQLILRNGTRSEDVQVAREAVRAAQENLQNAKSQKQLDVIYNEQVSSARSNLQSALAQVQIARQAIEDTRIKAPFAGTVSGKPAQPGTIAGPGTVIARIIGGGGAYFQGQVPEAQISRIRAGMPVAVTISALPGRLIPGVVQNVSPLGQDVGRLFSVRIQLKGGLAEIRPGMFATGSVTLQAVPNATVVPASAIVRQGDAEFVFVADKGKARKLTVKTGLREGDWVVVSGLQLGDQVIVKGQDALSDGSLVRPTVASSASITPSTVGG